MHGSSSPPCSEVWQGNLEWEAEVGVEVVVVVLPQALACLKRFSLKLSSVELYHQGCAWIPEEPV